MSVRRVNVVVLSCIMLLVMSYCAMAAVAINEENFPDDTFRWYVADYFDKDGDLVLSDSEIADISYVYANETFYLYNGLPVRSLKGIEHFHNLNYIYCSGLQLRELDISKNTALQFLECGRNQLTKLDVSNNTALTTLACGNNQLTELDIGNNTALQFLNCWDNHLTELDVSNNTALTSIACLNNQLTELDVSNHTALTELLCFNNQLTKLDVSNDPALQNIRCFNNQLTELYLGNDITLISLDCSRNQLTKLNVSTNTALQSLRCGSNQIKELDVSNNTALQSLECGHNKLIELDVSNNTALQSLECGHNKLIELDVSNNIALQILHCFYNQLSELDVSKNTALSVLWCGNNQLTELDLSNNTSLSTHGAGNQTVYGLKDGVDMNLVDSISGIYNFDLGYYVSQKNLANIGLIWAHDGAGNIIGYDHNYNQSTGIMTIYGKPSRIFYFYNTGQGTMEVTIKANDIDIAALGPAFDRGTYYSIINSITKSSYKDADSNNIDEQAIATLRSDTFGKTGLAVDGNARLIVRARTNTPGKFRFSSPAALGLTFERLTDRAPLSSDLTEWLPAAPVSVDGETLYQTSIVVIAPKEFPELMLEKFPRFSSWVRTDFLPDSEGETYDSETLPLTIESVPVVLVHGRTSTVADTFGTAFQPFAVRRVLQDAGLYVEECNYTNYKGPSQNITGPDNKLAKAVNHALRNMTKRGIACTKVDLVCHSMGGLMARQFLRTDIDTGLKSLYSYGGSSVRRIVTIATPHGGSQAANFLLDVGTDELRRSFAPISSIRGLARDKFKSKSVVDIDKEGDLIDLAVGSEFLEDLRRAEKSLQTERVPIYVLYGRIRDYLRPILTAASSTASTTLDDVSIYLKVEDLFITDPLISSILQASMSLVDEARDFVDTVKIVLDVLYQGQDYDIAVSEECAVYDDCYYIQAFTGMQYTHTAVLNIGEGICKQEKVGKTALALLKGPELVLEDRTSASSSKASYVPTVNTIRTAAVEQADSEASITEHFALKASTNNLTVNGEASVTYTAELDEPLAHDVYMILNTKYGDGIAKIADKGSTSINITLNLSSADTGIMNVSLLSHGSEDNTLFTSNVQPLIVRPSITTNQITGLEFNTDTIFTTEGYSSAIGLYVETDNGQLHDALLWSSDLMFTVGDESIAVVEGKSTVRGVSEGVTRLTASFGGFTASVSVDVSAAASSPTAEAPSITTTSLPAGRVGAAYSTQLQASGTAPITWTLDSGDAPGLKLSASGLLSGTPSREGSFTLTITASNNAGKDSATLTLSVAQAQSPSTPSDPAPSPSTPEPSTPEPSTPEPSTPEPTNPEPSTPEPSEPEPSTPEPSTPEPEPSEPEPTPAPAPEPSEPEPSEPEPSTPEPEPSEPEPSTPDPEPSEPEPSEPEPSQDPEPEPEPVPEIIVGSARSISSLSIDDIDALSNDTSMIAAVLPELTVNASDSYNFRNIAIYSNVPAGLPLVWNGFASGYDDSRADFFNADGANTSTVPQDHVINITAYLEAGKTYAPVITATLPKDDNTDSQSEVSGSGGGGGCDSGLVGIMLAVLCAMALRKK